MAIVDEQDNFGKRVAETLGLDPRSVVGIDIRIEPGNFVTATARLFLKEKQVKGLGIIFDEMRFVGVKKPEAVPEAPCSRPAETRATIASRPKKFFPWLAIAILIAGCSPQPQEDLRPWLATSGMYSLMSPSPAPLPPAPTPGAKCENCRGTGVVGDKVTGITCPICGGTGVAPAKAPREAEAASRAPVPTAGVPAPPPAHFAAPGAVTVGTDGGPTFRVVCEDGVCRRVKVMSATGR